jgi:hypothetical protein
MLVAGCATEAPIAQPATHAPQPARRALSDDLADAIEASDLERALSTLCEAYAAAGAPCAETLFLERLEPSNVMARAGVIHNIQMPPMLARGAGFAYWDNWSAILSNGSWQPRAFFVDDEEARRVANMLLVTVLAHELGHHVASRYGCSLSGQGEELRADELSTPLIAGLTEGRLGPLHQRMRVAADAMIDAVPVENRLVAPREGDLRAWVGQQGALPTAIPSYVTLHLSRQRRLLEEHEPVASVAQRLCLAPFAARMSSRSVRPGRVRALAPGLPSPGSVDLVAIDHQAHVWVAQDGPTVVLRRLGEGGPTIEVQLPETASGALAFAAFSDDLLAISDFQSVWLVEHRALREVGRLTGAAVTLGFDEAGTLFEAHEDATHWYVAPVGATPAPPRWTIARGDGVSGWADGALDVARASPTGFTVVGDQVVFADRAREAVRAAGPGGLVTLAGSQPGRRDGPAEQATFFGIEAIAPLAGGRVAALERDFAKHTFLVRVIEP